MSSRVLTHFRHNAVAYVALFLALGMGGAWAADRLGNNAVHSRHIARGAVKSQDLAPGAVTSPKVENGSLLGEDFAGGVLTSGPQGPEGAQGPVGPRGRRGPRGPQGPAGGMNSIVRVSQSPLTLDPGEAGTVLADCAPTEVATGGGVKFLNVDDYDIAAATYPRTAAGPAGAGDTPTGWAGRLYNGTATAKDGVAYVVCAQP